jgi:predicted helicase
MNTEFRKYQQEAHEAIFEELQENNKCLVKMFCGTGKSKLMRYCSIAQNKKLVVYVEKNIVVDNLCMYIKKNVIMVSVKIVNPIKLNNLKQMNRLPRKLLI